MSNDRTSLTVATLRDLVEFGLNPLTGEACAYGQRILFDVNEEGRALLSEFFGIPDLQLAPPMNSFVGSLPSIGSIMLAPALKTSLARFAGFRAGALGYMERESEVTVLFTQDLVDRYIAADFAVHRNPAATSTAPRVGSRNVHQMTGRVL